MEQLHGGGDASPVVPAQDSSVQNGSIQNGPALNGPALNGPAVNGPAVNGTGSSRSVVADLTDQHYLDASDLKQVKQIVDEIQQRLKRFDEAS